MWHPHRLPISLSCLPKETILMPDHKPRPEEKEDFCPKCGGELQPGFGLAGGGYGPYWYCENCSAVINKIFLKEDES